VKTNQSVENKLMKVCEKNNFSKAEMKYISLIFYRNCIIKLQRNVKKWQLLLRLQREHEYESRELEKLSVLKKPKGKKDSLSHNESLHFTNKVRTSMMNTSLTGINKSSCNNSRSSTPDRKLNLFAFHEDHEIIKYLGGKSLGRKKGFGVQTWKNGDIYKGFFDNNQANGLGIFHHNNGDIYFGSFLGNIVNGFGFYNDINKGVYIGSWMNDTKNGLGIETWGDGSSYSGEYLNGRKHGLGKYIWKDLSIYEGEWYENSLHGFVIILIYILGNILF
jgi:hypothetical protein